MDVARVYKLDGGFELVSLDDACEYLHSVLPVIAARTPVDTEFQEHAHRIWKEVWSVKLIRSLLSRGVALQTDTMWFVAVEREEGWRVIAKG